MSKLGRVIFFSLLIGTSPLTLSAQTQGKNPKEGSSTVTGKVTLKGEPARSAVVLLEEQRSGLTSDSPGAKTDENGRFRITKIPAGAYFIRAIAPGSVAAGSPSEARGKSLNLAEGEIAENIDFELRRGAVITGRVVDQRGRPLVEERVSLSGLNDGGKPVPLYLQNSYEMSATDDRGVYRIFGLPEGRYLVSVGISRGNGPIAAGSNPTYYPQTFHPDATKESDAKIIEVGEGAEVTGVDITAAEAKKAYNVYGRIVDAESGEGVAAASITYGGVSPDGGLTGERGSNGDRSDANGEFHLRGVLSGKFALFAVAGQDGESYSDPVFCEVLDGDLRGVEIKTRRGGSISGSAVIEGTDDPAILRKVSKIQLGLVNRSGQGGGSRRATVNSDGSFRINGARPGRNFFAMMFDPELQGIRLSRIERDGVPQRDGVEVGPGEQVSNVRLVYSYGSLKIRGEVKVIGGALPGGLSLYVRSGLINMPLSNGAELDTRGQFTIENLSPGEYEVFLFPFIPDPKTQVAEQLLKAIQQVKQRVIVGADNQPRVTLTLDLSLSHE
jgi:hypothetical protein